MNKFTPFVKWLWLKRDTPAIFRTSTLTESNRREDPSLPVPPLTFIEAETLFRFLARKELVFFDQPTDAFIINKIESYRWAELIEDLETPEWKRSKWFKRLTNGSWFVVVAIVSGILGGLTVHAAELFVDHIKESLGQPVANHSTDNGTNPK